MQVGQTWIHNNGLERVTLEERSEDKTFWYITKMQLVTFASKSDYSKTHDMWTGSMKTNLNHYGNDIITDKDLLENCQEMVFAGAS